MSLLSELRKLVGQKSGPLSVEISNHILALGLSRPDGQILMTVPIGQTVTDYVVQRPTVPARTNKMEKDWIPKYAAVARLSQRGCHGLNRDGKFFINDGNNQNTARKNRLAAGFDDDTNVLALVEVNSSRKNDAKSFSVFNNCKAVSASDKFRADLAMGDVKALECESLIEYHGFELEFRTATARKGDDLPCGICSVAKLYTAYCKMPQQLNDALRLMVGVYGKPSEIDLKYRSGEIISGMAHFLGGQFGSVESIIDNLKPHPLDLLTMWKMVQSAPHSTARPVQLGALINDAYTLILKGQMPRWILKAA